MTPPREAAAAAPPLEENTTGPNDPLPREPAAFGPLEKPRTNGRTNQAAPLQLMVAGKPLPANLVDMPPRDVTLRELYSDKLLNFNSEELAPAPALEGPNEKDEVSEEDGEVVPLSSTFPSLPDVVWAGSAACPYNMAIGNSAAPSNPYNRLRATTASFAQYRSQQLHKRKDDNKGSAKVLRKDWVMAAQHLYNNYTKFKEYFDTLSKNVYDLDNGGAAM